MSALELWVVVSWVESGFETAAGVALVETGPDNERLVVSVESDLET